MPGGCHYSQSVLEDLLLTLSPLLERQPPSREMCAAFSRHCRLHPRSSLVRGLFTSVVHRILKHNVVSLFKVPLTTSERQHHPSHAKSIGRLPVSVQRPKGGRAGAWSPAPKVKMAAVTRLSSISLHSLTLNKSGQVSGFIQSELIEQSTESGIQVLGSKKVKSNESLLIARKHRCRFKLTRRNPTID